MKVVSNNKKAFFDFFISDLLEAGIVLEGCEVKSVRAGGASLTDSFVVVKNGEMFLIKIFLCQADNQPILQEYPQEQPAQRR
jgi:SsrA-binding protein